MTGRSVLQNSIEVPDHTELGENDGGRRVAVEALDLVAGKLKDVATRRVHPLAGCRNGSCRQAERTSVCSLESELHDNDVVLRVHSIDLAMHVRERDRVALDSLPELIGTAVHHLDGLVGEGAVICESRDPTGNVHVFRNLVCPADYLFVVPHVSIPLAVDHSWAEWNVEAASHS
jgi:hypothetical protein